MLLMQDIGSVNRMNNNINTFISEAKRFGATIAFILPALVLFAGIANAATTNAQLSIPVLAINGTSFSSGNTITLTATASGGTGPYTYNFSIESAATKQLLVSSGPMLNSNIFSISASPTLNGADIAIVQVTDSATPPASAVSSPTAFTVNSTLRIISNPAIASNSTSNQAALPVPPASTSVAGAGIVVIILLAVVGIFLYGRSRKR